ncbi:MAG: glycosyltransferase family 4 protein [Candidatus Promineifilaceae bacterium]
MRIAYYLVDYTALGGIQTHLVTLASAVSHMGHDVYAILPATAVLDPMLPPLQDAGVTVHRLNNTPFTRRDRLAMITTLARLLRQIQPDLLHIQQSVPGYDQKATLVARLVGVPITLITEHDYPRPLGGLRDKLLPTLTHLVDGVITVSHFSRQLLTNKPYPSHKIAVVHNGIDLDEFNYLSEKTTEKIERTAPAEPDRFTIGYLGRLEPHKGIDDLLHATALLLPIQPNLHVEISGDGPERPSLEALAQALGIANHVHFLGRVPNAANFLRQLDIFVLPSRFEAFGLVAAEAMAVGTPVIVTNAGGLPEVVADGQTGLVVPVDNRPALAQAIGQLAAQPTLRQQLIQAGKQHSQTYFSVARMADETVNLYQKHLAQ